MVTDRRFCRFTRGTDRVSLHEVPEDGFCLSAFVIVTPASDPLRVLLGHLNPAAPWDHLAAMTPDRVLAHQSGWLLPASQLIYGESPDDAARRVVREQLGGLAATLEGPHIVSEVYAPRRFPEARGHWDLEFLYRASVDAAAPELPSVWRDLRFEDVRTVPRGSFGRSHDEVLDHAGFSVASRP